MDKRLMLAVAGSGKTYTLCYDIDESKNNIIIAYTKQNIRNIENELIKRYGYIPKNTKVLTFHSFVYRYLIRPYEQDIANYYYASVYHSKGLAMCDPPKCSYLTEEGHYRPNPKYYKDNDLKHYLIHDKYYSSLISKLIVKTKNKCYNLCREACSNLKKTVHKIYIDEFQDFRKYDYDLLMLIIKEFRAVLLVGDYYQHSVNATNNSGKPFKSKSTEGNISYSEYIELIKSYKIEVDTATLCESRRCSVKVCEFVQNKLQIDILPSCHSKKDAQIRLIEKVDEIEELLKDNTCHKLTYMNSDKYCFRCINWGYSKGDTYEAACVILSKDLSGIMDDDFNIGIISEQTINKFYVAVTRARGNLYLVKECDFKKVCSDYLK